VGWAVVRGLSADAATLVLGHDPGPGAVLLLQLPRRPEGKTSTRLARVAWVELQPSGNYLVVCLFTPPLSGKELDGLLV
jgi:hypothetical protein